MLCRGKQKGKKEWKKELTKGRKADKIYQVVSDMTTLKEPNLKKIEKKVLTGS